MCAILYACVQMSPIHQDILWEDSSDCGDVEDVQVCTCANNVTSL